MINFLSLSKYASIAKAGFIIGAAAICFFAGVGYKKAGADRDIARLKLDHVMEVQKVTLAHQKTMQSIDAANRKIIDDRNSQIDNIQREFAIADEKHYQEMKNAQRENDRRNADLISKHRVQLVKINAVACSREKGNDTEKPDGTAYAELDGKTAVGAFGVTDYGDQAIKDLNALQVKVIEISKVCPIEFI